MKIKQIEPRGRRLRQKNRDSKSTAAVPDLPADMAVESEARARQEAESQEVMPASASALIHATLGEAGEGVMSALRVRFARADDDHVLVLLHTIEQRLERFLGTAAKPSVYAEVLVNFSGRAPTPGKGHTRQIVAEFQIYLTAELNPLLHELSTRLAALPASDVHAPDDLLTLLQAGEVRNQKTTSLFGVLRQLTARFPDLPALHLESPVTPQRIVVVQPLDPQFESYWKERLSCRETYGEATLPELVALRSGTALVELQETAERLTAPEEKETAAACFLLAHWMEEQALPFQEDRASKPDELAFIVRRLHFGRGNPDEVIDLLNAAEIIKRHQPALYVRLCGIAPRYNHGSSGSTEAGRSDLFGNVFQIALARSLEVRIRTDNTTNTLFHERMYGLTQLNTKQQLLQHLDETQLRQLERNIKRLQKDAATGSATERATSGILALLASKMYLEASLPRMLEAIQSTEWEEERERLIERLRVAGPGEFIRLIDAAPQELGNDPEIQKILQDRVLSAASQNTLYPFTIGAYGEGGDLEKAIVRQIVEPADLYRSLRIHKKEMGYSGVWDQVIHLLWQTAPDETVVSREFLRFLSRKKIKSRDDILPMLKILHAHPHITQEQWTACYKDLAESEYRLFSSPVFSSADRLDGLARTMWMCTAEDLIGTSTTFFASEAMSKAKLGPDAKENIGKEKYAALGYRLYGTERLINEFGRYPEILHYAEHFFQQFPKEEIPLIVQNILTTILEGSRVPLHFLARDYIYYPTNHFMQYVKDHFASDSNITQLLAQVHQKLSQGSAE